MILTIDTSQPLSDDDRALLLALAGGQQTVTAPIFEPETAVEPTPTPAASKSRRAPKAQAAPETVPESAPVDLRAKAVARASELLSGGQRDRVMAALQETGAPRVSEIDDEHLPSFLEALTD